jgi:hypothetical protein
MVSNSRPWRPFGNKAMLLCRVSVDHFYFCEPKTMTSKKKCPFFPSARSYNDDDSL